MARRRPAARGDRRSACRASMPTCWRFPRSIRPAGASTGTRRSTARCAGWPISAKPSARRSLRQVHRLHGDIARLADSMEAPQRSGAERNFARLLRHALTAPGEDTLYVVDGKPVMTFWGFTADAALPGVFLAEPAGRRRGPPCARDGRFPKRCWPRRLPSLRRLARARRGGSGCCSACCCCSLLALPRLAGAALSAASRAASRGRGARPRARNLAVRQPLELQQTRVDTLQQDNENLRLELARLTDELSRTSGGDCAAGIIVPGGVIVGAVMARRSNAARRPNANAPTSTRPARTRARTRQGSRKGPDDKNVDKGERRAPIPRAKTRTEQRQGQEGCQQGRAQADGRAARGQAEAGPRLPEGRLALAHRPRHGDRREGHSPDYTLDDKGKGKVSFVQKNGATCEAPAEARWDGGKLVIEEKANPKCSRRSHLCPQHGQLRGRRRRRCQVQGQPARRHSAAITCRSAVDPYR